MLANIQNYFGPEIIYLWLNFGVIPLWLILIFFPNSNINKVFISSIFLPIIFSTLYIYILYQVFSNGENIIENLNFYIGIENLNEMFSNDKFLLIFWVHFLSLNLFLGSWVSKDRMRNNLPRFVSGISLVLIYFTSLLGLVFYWFVRIFYAKKISLHD